MTFFGLALIGNDPNSVSNPNSRLRVWEHQSAAQTGEKADTPAGPAKRSTMGEALGERARLFVSVRCRVDRWFRN
jgi:hypothetical protein